MTTPAKLKLTIYQGATFRRPLRWASKAGVPIDLTGCTARMQVRAVVEAPEVLLELTTDNGGIALGETLGTIELKVSPELTAAMKWESGVFDLEIVHPNGDVTRVAGGTVSVKPEVTRA